MLLAANVLAGILAVIYLAVGVPKVAGSAALAGEFVRFGYPRPLLTLTGAAEVAGAGLLVAGIVSVHAAAVVGSALLIAVMAGAVATHVRVSDPATKIAPPALLLLLLVAELALRAAS
ncbi:MAG: DoxX family protein [Mycobacteriales bacterium]